MRHFTKNGLYEISDNFIFVRKDLFRVSVGFTTMSWYTVNFARFGRCKPLLIPSPLSTQACWSLYCCYQWRCVKWCLRARNTPCLKSLVDLTVECCYVIMFTYYILRDFKLFEWINDYIKFIFTEERVNIRRRQTAYNFFCLLFLKK